MQPQATRIPDLPQVRLDGDSGTWTLSADRAGNDVVGDAFNGDDEFFLDCTGITG